MMKVVKDGGEGREGKVVAAVVMHGDHHDIRLPGEGDQRVAGQQQRPGDDRKQVRNDVLHRVAVDGGEGNGGGPLVVPLVDGSVEERVVEGPVGVVEEQFADEGEDGPFKGEPGEGWKAMVVVMMIIEERQL